MKVSRIAHHLKKSKTRIVSVEPVMCPACCCVRFGQKSRNAFDIAFGVEARFKCDKCAVSTLLIPQSDEPNVVQMDNGSNDQKEESPFAMGCKYALGQGVAKSSTDALAMFRIAAERGSAKAQYNVGVLYLKGEGIAQDLIQGQYWLALASSNGHEGASKVLPRLMDAIVADG